jgi:hypothetical protein
MTTYTALVMVYSLHLCNEEHNVEQFQQKLKERPMPHCPYVRKKQLENSSMSYFIFENFAEF